MHIREQSLSRGSSEMALRRPWLTLRTVWPSHSQISSLSTAIWVLGRARSSRETNLGDVMLCQKSLHKSCRMGRRIVVMKLICSLGHCECDGHSVHKLTQRRLTADWLDPRESDCSRMHGKVSTDWLSSYIKATRPVLGIFKMPGYWADRPRTMPRERKRQLHLVTLRITNSNITCYKFKYNNILLRSEKNTHMLRDFTKRIPRT
jgi:hypothetical protein